MWYIYEASYITCTTCSTTLHVKISKNLEYSEHCVPFFGTSQSTRNSHSLISCSIYNLESCFISILHCAPLHVHHRFAVRTAVPRGQTAVSTSANCTPFIPDPHFPGHITSDPPTNFFNSLDTHPYFSQSRIFVPALLSHTRHTCSTATS